MCVREITAFHEILIDPASWTRRGREREREGVRGEGWRGGVEGGYSFAQPLSCSHYQHRYRLHPSLPRSISLKKKQICFIYFPIMTTTADFRLALCFTDLKHDKAAV